MKAYSVLQIVLCVVSNNLANALSSEEISEGTETCCSYGENFAITAALAQECARSALLPDDIEPEQEGTCRAALTSCCEQQFRQKEECSAGMKLAPAKRCSVPKSDVGKTCCEECSFGRLTGESQGKDACGGPAEEYVSPSSALRKNAYHQCCLEAANRPETTTQKPTTTTEKRIETTTEKKKVKQTCKTDSCAHICNDDDGRVICHCREGFRLQSDKKSCKDINECAEAIDDLCTAEGTVCHNTPGAFKCVPIKKRDVSRSCPPGFKRNVVNQVCDDINECQLPRPPCPKYLCENTIGGYKCSGKPGKPFEEDIPGVTTEASSSTPSLRNDICPPGFRAGPDDECIDINECEEHLDDCQRLSQHCINTHGNFFCQDHVSKRCAPGFVVNSATGICEDIDECVESTDVCKSSEVCVNMPGAYTCKSKISTLPKLTTKTCQEGTRVRPGGTICEDIDECREGTHLCDQFQNCINTFRGHECRCKTGFELDSTGSCVDIDECALKLDSCAEGTHCLNVLGTFTCTRRAPPTSTTTPAPVYEYEYYDSDEVNSTIDNETIPQSTPVTTKISTTTPKPTTTTAPRTNPTRPPYTPHSRTTTSSPTFRTTTTRKPYVSRNRPRPPTTVRPEVPVTPRRTPSRRPEIPAEVTLPTPNDPVTVEREKDAEGSYAIDTSDIPKDRWTNVSGRERTEKPERSEIPERPERPVRPERPGNPERPEKPERPERTEGSVRQERPARPERPEVPERPALPERPEPEFDPNLVHCLNGYERNSYGECVDTNECETGHICSSVEVCKNRPGGYYCECKPGYQQDMTGACTPTPTAARPTTTSTTTTTTTTTERVTPASIPEWYAPRPTGRSHAPPSTCELGYSFDSSLGKCIDIDECLTEKPNCAPYEDCVNVDGGYRCVCTSRRCRTGADTPTYVPPPREPVDPDHNVITVGAQYGQRGLRYLRPSFQRLPNTGAIVTSCPWGYKLTQEKMCLDIDECAKNVSECGPQQKCENFYGGYSCQCPAGHRLQGQAGCEDIDECVYGKPCPYNSQCVNTVGSYRCACGEGFRNAPSNDKVCVDVDECADTPGVCEQACANAWGGYRCYCKKGYRLHSDNRTCVDVDECTEFSRVRQRGRLCGGECVNEPGSYRCACPKGYRLSEDGRSCIDIDECDTGEATCARADLGQVCQNTRGGYHCHTIDCPRGYRLESKHRCTRIQRSCPVSDWSCLQQPSTYSFNFITFVANIYLPEGSVDLFTMHGPAWRDSMVNFEMRMVDVQASPGVRPADLSCFDMRPSNNVCVISLLCSLAGPQVAELELTMSLYQRGQFAGSAVARLVVIVSQYEF